MEPPRILKDSVSIGLAMICAIVVFMVQFVVELIKILIKNAPILLLLTFFVMQGMKFQFLDWDTLKSMYGERKVLLLFIGSLVLILLWLATDALQNLYSFIRSLFEKIGGLAIYINHLRRTGDLGSLRENVIVDKKSTIISFLLICAIIILIYIYLGMVL